jgi:hypothetical protein
VLQVNSKYEGKIGWLQNHPENCDSLDSFCRGRRTHYYNGAGAMENIKFTHQLESMPDAKLETKN